MPGRFRFNRRRVPVEAAAPPPPPFRPNWYVDGPAGVAAGPGELAVPPEFQFNPGPPPRRGANPAPREAQNVFAQQNAAQAQVQLREIQRQLQEDIQGIVNKEKPMKPPKPTRASANGRMRTVRFGDILKSYRRTTGLHRDHYAIIDFRPPKEGDYFMDTQFTIQRTDEAIDAPFIILELVKGKKKEIEEPFDFDMHIRDVRER